MEAAMKIAVILTAFDKMSSVVNKATDNAENRMKKLMQKNFAEGAGMMGAGVSILAGMQPAISAYSKLEVANTDLQASMMNSNGAIDKNFKAISGLAEGLGDKLPGTTADFYQLFQTMMNNGVKSESILNGVGKAAAYLAVDLKMPYEAAGQFAARMKEATGVADNEMLGFMDTISRANSLGIEASEMQYAFSRSAGSLKMLGLQGLQSSKDMTVFYASLIRGGMSGETAATSFNNIVQNVLDKKKFEKFFALGKSMGMNFSIFDKAGKFMGVENMVSQFDKMKGLSTVKKAELVQALTGGGADGQALNTIITGGVEGFRKMRGEMEAKAKLDDKVTMKLKTLSSMWEATTGTIENMTAALGAGLAPVLKPIIEMIGAIAGKLKIFMTVNPGVAKFIMLVASLVGVFLTLMGAVKIIKAIQIGMALLNVTMMANPFMLIAAAAIIAVGLIYANWEKIGPYFVKIWAKVKAVFMTVFNFFKGLFLNFTPAGLIFKHWDKLSPYFKGLWGGVKNAFSGFLNWVAGFGARLLNFITAPIRFALNFFNGTGKNFFNAGKNIIMSIANGIKSAAMYPINKVKEMVGKIRNLLPFSPAKDGPLRDIHRIRLVETIADSIKPTSLLNKMRNVAKVAFDVMQSKPGGAPSFNGGSSGGGGSTNVTFAIHLNGSATKQDAGLIMEEIKKQFPALMKKYNAGQTRVAF